MSESDQATIKIVVIDDHEIVRNGLVAMMNAQQDMTVVAECGDADSGLEKILETNPDIVVTDIAMPGGSPFEMVDKAKEKLPALKVVFLTAFSTDGNLVRSMRSGGSGFVTKVDPIDTLIQSIRIVNSGETFFSDEAKKLFVDKEGGAIGEEEFTAMSKGLPKGVTVRKELLSPREIEVLCCVAKGSTAKQIADALHISAKTVERHKSNIMAKLEIHSQVDLARYAIREGLISP